MNNLSSQRAVLALVLLSFSALLWAKPPINTLKRGLFSDSETGIAINGYDSVAYFTQNQAVAGQEAFSYEWNGATWRFSSAAHLQQFQRQPEKFAPQFGGYCAYGVSRGYLVTIEPDQFSIINNKLYLNYDAKVQKKWKKDTAGYIRQAEEKFADLLQK